VFRGMGTEVNVSDAATESGVAADLDQQMLLGACCLGGSVGLGTHIVAQSASTEDVIPTADLEHGNGNPRKIFLDRHLLPVIVIIGMRQPVVIIGRESSSELGVSGQLAEIENGIVGERERGRADEPICVLLDQASERV